MGVLSQLSNRPAASNFGTVINASTLVSKSSSEGGPGTERSVALIPQGLTTGIGTGRVFGSLIQHAAR